MKPKPIIFTPENVKLIFEGNKTMTRRLLKPQPEGRKLGGYIMDSTGRDRRRGEAIFYRGNDIADDLDCLYVRPRYAIGDIIYVKETHWRWGFHERVGGHWRFHAGDRQDRLVMFSAPPRILLPHWRGNLGYHKRPSLFMPRRFARLFLRVTEERAEQLQDISGEDARAEGIGPLRSDGRQQNGFPASDGFADLWNLIHKKKSPWKRNDWVWVYGFERIKNADTKTQ